jgi:hypothetical protein
VKAAMIEKFKDRYDLDDLSAEVPEDLEEDPYLSWRKALDKHIDPQGEDLYEEIREAVREHLPDEHLED